MEFNHKEYPIIIGASYENNEGDVGTLEVAEIRPNRNEAEIIINMHNFGMFYKLNYPTFMCYWRLKNNE